MRFITELRKRNALLYWFGWYNFLAGLVCIVLILSDKTQILGISRWIKPTKFFLSIGLMAWTMGWILYYLQAQKKVKVISWLIVITMFVENAIITLQVVRGQTSHFNVTSALNGMLFSTMGVFIIIFTLASAYATWLFFRQKEFSIPASYYWGIRLGLVFFILFSLEAGFMLSLLSHTVGGKDGGPGLPLLNWSTTHGDLRIAHFLGIHSLQLLPLAGYYLTKSKRQIVLFSAFYFLLLIVLLVQALRGIPLSFKI